MKSAFDDFFHEMEWEKLIFLEKSQQNKDIQEKRLGLYDFKEFG